MFLDIPNCVIFFCSTKRFFLKQYICWCFFFWNITICWLYVEILPSLFCWKLKTCQVFFWKQISKHCYFFLENCLSSGLMFWVPTQLFLKNVNCHVLLFFRKWFCTHCLFPPIFFFFNVVPDPVVFLKNDNLQVLLFVCLTVLFMSIFMFCCVFFCAGIMCYPLGQILLFVLPRAVFVFVFRAN